MIKSIILEDIIDNQESLSLMLDKYCPEIELCGVASNIDEAIELFKLSAPQLMFLDVQLDKGTSFDFLDCIEKEGYTNYEVIFVTGHGSYENVTKAIEFSAIDFITKPIEAIKLKNAVDKAVKRIGSESQNLQISFLLNYLKQSNNPVHKNKIALSLIKGVIEFVEISDIIWLQADGVVTHIFLADGTTLVANKNLGHYCALLTSEDYFFQISNSILVNLDYVKRYKHSDLSITLKNNIILYSSTRGGQDFKKFLEESKVYRKLDNSSGNPLMSFLKSI